MSTMKVIDNRGLSCPQPVINTRKALHELAAGESGEINLVSIVDNDIAAENVTRLAESAGCRVTAEKTEQGILISISGAVRAVEAGAEMVVPGSEPPAEPAGEDCSCSPGKLQRGTVVAVTSATLGSGSEELGAILMRGFMYTLKESGFLPAKMFFINGGVFLTTEGSPLLGELQEMALAGVELYSCGTCLDYYQLKEKLAVGQVTNMYDTVESITSASKCITL